MPVLPPSYYHVYTTKADGEKAYLDVRSHPVVAHAPSSIQLTDTPGKFHITNFADKVYRIMVEFPPAENGSILKTWKEVRGLDDAPDNDITWLYGIGRSNLPSSQEWVITPAGGEGNSDAYFVQRHLVGTSEPPAWTVPLHPREENKFQIILEPLCPHKKAQQTFHFELVEGDRPT